MGADLATTEVGKVPLEQAGWPPLGSALAQAPRVWRRGARAREILSAQEPIPGPKLFPIVLEWRDFEAPAHAPRGAMHPN